MLDLEIRHCPENVTPGWGYHNPEHRRRFDSIGEAFRASHYRLLVVAVGGAGKTTTLYRVAGDWAREARRDPAVPVPFIARLSNFTGRDTQVEEWLLAEMSACPGIDAQTARLWLQEQNVALFIDSLDELPDEQRGEVARLLNTTFLARYPHLPVLIASREDEYKQLQGSKETRLSLKSCVRLERLTDPQIASYLEAAGAAKLASSLQHDPVLRELAGVPLMLAMLVHVYASATADDLGRLSAGSASERRHELLELYAACMLQRQARRERGMVFDGVSRHDVPVREYRYSPRQVNAWLGWLASAMSARAQGSFAPTRIATLMPADVQPRREPLGFFTTYGAMAALLGLCMLALAAPIVPHTISDWRIAVAIIALACVLLPWIAAGRRSESELLATALRWSMWVTAVPLACCATAHAVCAVVDMSPSAAPLVSMVVAAAVAIGASIARADGWATQLRMLTVLLAFVLAGWALHSGWVGSIPGFVSDPRLQRVLLAVGLPLALLPAFVRSIDLVYLVISCILAIGLGAIAAFTGWVGPENWAASLWALASAAILVLLLSPRAGVTYLAIGAALVSSTGIVAGPAMAIVCAVVLVFVTRLVCVLGHWRIEFEMERVAVILQNVLLSPCIALILAITGRFPARKRRFITFATEAVLLRQTAGKVEFIHRIVRDHFALRRIVPRTAPQQRARFAAIRSLGYQGEASLSFLADLSNDDDPRVRAAAVEGLSHLASPGALHFLAERLTDSDPDVRGALVGALWLLGPPGAGILNRMRPTADGSEIPGLFRYKHNVGSEYWGNFEWLIEALGAAAVEPLGRYLRAAARWQRIRAARFLAVLHLPAAEALLIHQLEHDECAEVRATIVFWLRNSSTREARKAVGRSRYDKSFMVRHIALAHGIWEPLD